MICYFMTHLSSAAINCNSGNIKNYTHSMYECKANNGEAASITLCYASVYLYNSSLTPVKSLKLELYTDHILSSCHHHPGCWLLSDVGEQETKMSNLSEMSAKIRHWAMIKKNKHAPRKHVEM